MGLFTIEPDNFTGAELDSCPACREVRGVHNASRNRACSAQLGRPNFN